MIRNIVFDMGGVLIDYNPERTVREYFAEEYHDIVLSNVFHSKLWAQMDKGVIDANTALPIILPLLPEEIREAVTPMIIDFFPYMPPFEEGYELLKSSRGKAINAIYFQTPPRNFTVTKVKSR